MHSRTLKSPGIFDKIEISQHLHNISSLIFAFLSTSGLGRVFIYLHKSSRNHPTFH